MATASCNGQGFYVLPLSPWQDFRTLLAKNHLSKIESESLRRVYSQSLDDFERICRPQNVHAIDEHCLRYVVGEMLDEFSQQTTFAALMVVADALLWAEDNNLRVSYVFWGDALKAIDCYRQEQEVKQ